MSTPQKQLPTVKNAMSIDVEDYFHVAAFKSNIDPKTWDSMHCRIERNMDVVMSLLRRNNVKATFFTLGWLAQRYPNIVKNIVAEGHELASHGYGHQMIGDMTPMSFKEDVSKAKRLLEDVAGVAVKGYRAPSFSIALKTLWAHDVLADTGHQYSSSVYPIKHDLYGMPSAPRFGYQLPNGLIEIPATSLRIVGRNFPASGGGFFRLFPSSLSHAIIRKINRDDQQSAIFYCHPWEFDPDQPRVLDASRKSKFRHYINLKQNPKKFDQLLGAFEWAPIREVFSDLLSESERFTNIAPVISPANNVSKCIAHRN